MKLLKNLNLIEKLKESLASVLPITLIVLILSLTICPLPNDIFISFFVGALMLMVGMALFSLGAETSMTRMGNYIGAKLTKSRKIPVIAILCIVVGILITVAEPDLQVLASYTPIDTIPFVLTVAVGVGVFLAVAVMRIIFNVKIKYILLIGYGAVIILSFFVNPAFLPVAYDAGGVTTGAMSVPFIMAIGAGISAISSQRSDNDSSFGLMAVCSIGPILAIMILALFMGIDNTSYVSKELASFENSMEMGSTLLEAIPHHMLSVGAGLLPVLVFFLIFQLVCGRVGKNELLKVSVGAVYTFVGIVIFLTGVNVGFMPVGSYVGKTIASGNMPWIIIPIGMIFGYFMTSAEPAVQVLEKQAEDATSGIIPPKVLSRMMAVGVAVSTGIAMLRSLTGISMLPFIVTGYAIAVALSFMVPSIFTSIAFDAGGVASGAMAATFLLPLSVGVCEAVGGNVMNDAFGTIALVAMMPAISIQIVGLIYKIKLRHSEAVTVEEDSSDIVELDNAPENSASSDDYDTDIIEFDLVGKL